MVRVHPAPPTPPSPLQRRSRSGSGHPRSQHHPQNTPATPATLAGTQRPGALAPLNAPYAPLNVPLARKLPSGFTLEKSHDRDYVAAFQMDLLALAGENAFPLLRPHEGESPLHHVLRCWSAPHEELLSRADVNLSVTWQGYGFDHCVQFTFTAQQPPKQVVHLQHFRAACDAIHADLFGGLVDLLCFHADGYTPLFTAQDAQWVHEHLYFGEEYEVRLFEDYCEAHNLDAGETEPTETEVLKWAEEQGMHTPKKMRELLPDRLYRAKEMTQPEVVKLLESSACDQLPHVAILRKVVDRLLRLPHEFRVGRSWAQSYVHFGHVTVLSTQALGESRVDPTVEAWEDYTGNYDLDEMNGYVESLQVLPLRNKQESDEIVRYLQLLPEVQQLMHTLWAHLDDHSRL